MFSFRTTPIYEQEDRVLKSGRVGVFCTQSAWNPQTGKYIFEIMAGMSSLVRIFYMGEGVVNCNPSLKDVEFVRIDPLDPYSLSPEKFQDIDALIVEYQDLGSRYDEVSAVLFSLFQLFHHNSYDTAVYILDRENPTGRSVEGTMLTPEFVTANYEDEPVGIEGLPHRHGLTLGEVANLMHSGIDARFPLHIISYLVRSATQLLMPWSIPASSDYAGLFSSVFYSGTRMLECAGLSVGRGTSRPFEVFGAPQLKDIIAAGNKDGWGASSIADAGVFLRPTAFVPANGPFAGKECYGFQMIPAPGVQYHSLAHCLKILRFLGEIGCVDLSGAEMAVGDSVLFGYVSGELGWNDAREQLKVEEQKWIRKAKRYMLYDEQLLRVKSLK